MLPDTCVCILASHVLITVYSSLPPRQLCSSLPATQPAYGAATPTCCVLLCLSRHVAFTPTTLIASLDLPPPQHTHAR